MTDHEARAREIVQGWYNEVEGELYPADYERLITMIAAALSRAVDEAIAGVREAVVSAIDVARQRQSGARGLEELLNGRTRRS